jgi:hypothetical protein
LIDGDEVTLDGKPEPKLREELAGLGALMNLWYTRDIRIIPLPGMRGDAKRRRKLVAAEREEEIVQVCSSLACVGLNEDATLAAVADSVHRTPKGSAVGRRGHRRRVPCLLEPRRARRPSPRGGAEDARASRDVSAGSGNRVSRVWGIDKPVRSGRNGLR